MSMTIDRVVFKKEANGTRPVIYLEGGWILVGNPYKLSFNPFTETFTVQMPGVEPIHFGTEMIATE